MKDLIVTKHWKFIDNLIGNMDGEMCFYSMVLTLYIVYIVLAFFALF